MAGGSLRIPASFCGDLCHEALREDGLQPVQITPNCGMFDVLHALSVSVRDSAALLDTVAGPDVGAPYYAATAIQTFPGRGGCQSR